MNTSARCLENQRRNGVRWLNVGTGTGASRP
eukprot:COSAG01_NODE_71722_length_255_cov_0.647436_1_plen_30_part_10